jgi:multisubunit Na+/H+ antiporter MnhC subunit
MATLVMTAIVLEFARSSFVASNVTTQYERRPEVVVSEDFVQTFPH